MKGQQEQKNEEEGRNLCDVSVRVASHPEPVAIVFRHDPVRVVGPALAVSAANVRDEWKANTIKQSMGSLQNERTWHITLPTRDAVTTARSSPQQKGAATETETAST